MLACLFYIVNSSERRGIRQPREYREVYPVATEVVSDARGYSKFPSFALVLKVHD